MHLPDYIKPIAWTLFVVSGAVLLNLYFAPLVRKKVSGTGDLSLIEARTANVKVLEYGYNRIGDIDKFLVVQQGEEIWLHFPPHTARSVIDVAPKYTVLSVNFRIFNKKARDNKAIYELTSLRNNQTNIAVERLAPPPPASGKQIELAGKITEFRLDENGTVSGFVLDTAIIEIPKQVQQNIVPILKDAGWIVVKGYQRNRMDGFINVTGLTLVRPYAITINKTNYVL